MDPSPEPSVVSRSNLAIAVAFVAAVQLVALFITQVNSPAISESGYSYAPAGTSSVGSAGNALLLVLVVFATTLLSLYLVKRRKARIFKGMVFVGTVMAVFLLTLLTADNLIAQYTADPGTALLAALALTAVPTAMLVASTLRPKVAYLGPAVSLLISAEVGSYFASTIPLLTAIILPIAFSAYDMYAVFKGPLRQLVSITPDTLTGVSTRLGEFTIGMGDTVFYSMLPSLVLFQFDLSCALVTMVAVDVGVLITLRGLKRVKLLPGLPIPMGLGLLSILLCLRFF